MNNFSIKQKQNALEVCEDLLSTIGMYEQRVARYEGYLKDKNALYMQDFYTHRKEIAEMVIVRLVERYQAYHKLAAIEPIENP